MEYQTRAILEPDLDTFTQAYLECAEWCGLDDEGHEDLDLAVRPQWSPGAIHEAVTDCRAFQDDNAADLAGIDSAQAGHDFWLTRNRHGVGFWDRGHGATGQRLTDAAHVYGEASVYFDVRTEQLEFDL